MTSAIETAIRSVVGKGIALVADISRALQPDRRDNEFLTGIHEPLVAEETFENLRITGSIPPELDGTYLRIGPNPITAESKTHYHWFIGDGMVHGVRIRGGKALSYRNRWVRSNAVSEALDEPPVPGPRRWIDTVNTNVIGHAGRLWGLIEAGAYPVEFDSELNTRCHSSFGDTLAGSFAPHPHRDPSTGELHAICYDARETDIVRHVVVGADGRVHREEPIAVRGGPSVHDSAFTDRFIIVTDLPVTFSMAALLGGSRFPYRWNPEHQARIGLLPREGRGDDIIWCSVDPAYVFHIANAFDLPDGRVAFDVISHEHAFDGDVAGPEAYNTRLERWTVDPVARTTVKTLLDNHPQEFPRIDERRSGQAHRYVYTMALPERAGNSTFNASTMLFKHDLETQTRQTHYFGDQRFPGEFVFVPRGSAEDDGWLIGLVVDMAAQTTDLAILDAANFAVAPRALVTIPHRVPPGFHGSWVPV